MNNIILAAAPNGAYKQKSDHPALPINDEEIIAFVYAADKIKIPMVHLHIRDTQNQHSIDPEHYRALLDTLEKNTSLLIQVTSEAAGIFSAEEQIQMIRTLKPAFVSIALREINRATPQEVKDLFLFMRDNHINPQLILYTADDVQLYLELLKNGIGSKFPVLYVAGRNEKNHALSKVKDMIEKSSHLTTSWMLCGFSHLETQMLTFALEHHGHIRVGFENNLQLDNGSTANDNLERLTEVKHHITMQEKNIADVAATRTLLTPQW